MQIREDCVSRGFSLSLSPLSLSLSVSRSRSIVFQSLQSLSNANRTLLHSGVTEEEPSCGPTRDAIYDALAAAPRTPDQRVCVCVCVCVCVYSSSVCFLSGAYNWKPARVRRRVWQNGLRKHTIREHNDNL
jgi:hypothetical protein